MINCPNSSYPAEHFLLNICIHGMPLRRAPIPRKPNQLVFQTAIDNFKQKPRINRIDQSLPAARRRVSNKTKILFTGSVADGITNSHFCQGAGLFGLKTRMFSSFFILPQFCVNLVIDVCQPICYTFKSGDICYVTNPFSKAGIHL